MAPQSDLCESGCRVAWNAALPFTTKPLLRAALIRPLGTAAEALNRVGAADKGFQVRRSGGLGGPGVVGLVYSTSNAGWGWGGELHGG